MKKIAILGGLGAASTIAFAIVDAEKYKNAEYKFMGYINDKDSLETIQGYPILGGLNDINKLIKEDYYFINTIYKIDGQVERVKLFESLQIPQNRMATFVHPLAYVAPNVNLGAGTIIMPNAAVSSGVTFGINCRVMSGATIGHDNIIGDHSFFAANSTVGSHLQIGKVTYCGLNSTIGGKLTLGEFCVVGMGAVVTKNVSPYSIMIGNPAKHARFVNDKLEISE